tara:strand:- start:581 stop:970 length:390 start_codon:yes stop_codon:yes gene_type:complete
MSFIQSIYDKRHKFYLNFANEFFTKELWEKVLDEDKNACVLLCAFYSAIKNRCNTSVKETSEIVYNSLKSKCLKDETYEDFYKILNKHNLKLGFKANIPFLNSELKKGFEAFEKMYLFYETKMQEKGEI